MAKVARLTFVVVDGTTNWVNQTWPNSTRFHPDKLFFEDWLGVSSRCMCICVCVFFKLVVCFFLFFSCFLLEVLCCWNVFCRQLIFGRWCFS